MVHSTIIITVYDPFSFFFFFLSIFLINLNIQCSRLVAGVLQLAEGSHLTIDETQLKAGTLNSVGVENARLLKTLMELQKVCPTHLYFVSYNPAFCFCFVLFFLFLC